MKYHQKTLSIFEGEYKLFFNLFMKNIKNYKNLLDSCILQVKATIRTPSFL